MKLPKDKNLIFLDIDGVLNCEEFYEDMLNNGTDPHRWSPNRIIRHLHSICPKRTKMIYDLAKEFNAHIVLSSSWRSDGLKYLNKLFNLIAEGMEFYDVTPHLIYPRSLSFESVPRGCEILEWMRENVEEYHHANYVIFDDDSDMLYWQKDNFVHITDSTKGLTENDIEKARKILKTS